MSRPKMKAIRMANPENINVDDDSDPHFALRHKMKFYAKYHPITKPWIRKEIELFTRPAVGLVEIEYMGKDSAFALYARETDL